MEMNRNSWFMVGLLVLFMGFQMRMVDTFILNERVTKFLAERAPPAVADSGAFPKFLTSAGPTSRKSLHPPKWLGFAMLSVGSVLILHSLAMKKPGG
jgi:hypothetical protein